MQPNQIQTIENQIAKLTAELRALQAAAPPEEVPDYEFQTLEGKVSLLDLFGSNDTLLVIHNMGQGCNHCTLWADGINPFVRHLESRLALVLVSKDAPEVQRRFANDRGWRMRMASHGGGTYMRDHTACGEHKNYPGVACYQRKGDKVFKKNTSIFGPGDLYCSIYHLLGLAGIDLGDWDPKFSYWDRSKVTLEPDDNPAG